MFFNERVYRNLNEQYRVASTTAKATMFTNLTTDYIQAIGLLKAAKERIEKNNNPERLLADIKNFVERREDGQYQATKVTILQSK